MYSTSILYERMNVDLISSLYNNFTIEYNIFINVHSIEQQQLKQFSRTMLNSVNVSKTSVGFGILIGLY